MTNNPAFQLMTAMRQGKNPNVILQQMAGADPRIAQAMQMIYGRSPQQLQEMAQNMAQERGVNLEDVARSLGISIPSNR